MSSEEKPEMVVAPTKAQGGRQVAASVWTQRLCGGRHALCYIYSVIYITCPVSFTLALY